MPEKSREATELERFEKQYHEIAVLAGGLAHEIRNPLSTIHMNLELLFEELEESVDPATHRILRKMKTIQDQCENLEEILEAFLQFARAGELHLEEVNLVDVVTEFLEFYKPKALEHNIDVRPHFSSDLPSVRLDLRLIKQVLTNLVQNAQQAMPEGGLLELQTSHRDGSVVLEIIDTGCGMSPQSLEKMFHVFFSTKPNGSGLGLPTVRKIVEAHHGTIQCESELNRGTKFTLTFPVRTKEELAEQEVRD